MKLFLALVSSLPPARCNAVRSETRGWSLPSHVSLHAQVEINMLQGCSSRARRLELELARLLPAEVGVAEVAVLGGLAVDGLREAELLDDDTRAEVEVVADDLDELVRGLGGGAVGLDEDGQRLSNTNGVRELDEGTAGEAGVDEGLGNPSGEVGSRAVDLAVVLSGESTTTVGSPSTVGVDDDLTAGETGVTLRTTDDEEARWLDLDCVSSWKEVFGYVHDSHGRQSCRRGGGLG